MAAYSIPNKGGLNFILPNSLRSVIKLDSKHKMSELKATISLIA